jgi:ubiquinone/menaquinone biosynthesis C-methylase UbiE
MDKPKAGLSQLLFAWALAHFNTRYERFVARYKLQLFAGVIGTVLEIGPGTGANLRYLNPDKVHWIGIEPNPFMDAYLREEATRLGMQIEIRTGIAEGLPLADASVDAAISTLVLCSVASQAQSLQEVLRVLKPGGKFVFIEHVAAPQGTWSRRIQNLVTPLWKWLGDGCHPNRETWLEIERSGFENVRYERITAPTPIVSPQIVGVAIKPSSQWLFPKDVRSAVPRQRPLPGLPAAR